MSFNYLQTRDEAAADLFKREVFVDELERESARDLVEWLSSNALTPSPPAKMHSLGQLPGSEGCVKSVAHLTSAATRGRIAETTKAIYFFGAAENE